MIKDVELHPSYFFCRPRLKVSLDGLYMGPCSCSDCEYKDIVIDHVVRRTFTLEYMGYYVLTEKTNNDCCAQCERIHSSNQTTKYSNERHMIRYLNTIIEQFNGGYIQLKYIHPTSSEIIKEKTNIDKQNNEELRGILIRYIINMKNNLYT
jgi:hypothetical protein